MDMKKNSKIPKCGELPDPTLGKVVVGSKQLRKAMQKGLARYVFLAENADPAITAPLELRCQTEHIPYVWIPTMWELGSACGIEVGAAAAAAVN